MMGAPSRCAVKIHLATMRTAPRVVVDRVEQNLQL